MIRARRAKHVRNPVLSANYDYSHFEFTGISLADSLAMLLPYTTFIQVKDARMEGGRRHYLLPGEGDIDYAEYYRLLHRHNYQGPVVVEISAHVTVAARIRFHDLRPEQFRRGRRRPARGDGVLSSVTRKRWPDRYKHSLWPVPCRL